VEQERTWNTASMGALATTMTAQARARATDVLRTLRIVMEVMGWTTAK